MRVRLTSRMGLRGLRVAIGAGAVVATGSGLCAYGAPAWRAAARAPVEAEVAPARESPHIDLPARLGEVARHPFQLEVRTTISPGALLGGTGGQRRDQVTSVKGTLADVALDGAGESLLAVDDVEVEIDGRRDATAESALHAGVVIDREPSGAVARVRFPREATESEAGLLRAIAFSVEWTPSKATSSWTAQEASPGGPVDMRYSVEGSRVSRRVERVHPRSHAMGELTESGTLRDDVDASGSRLIGVDGEWSARIVNAAGEEAAVTRARVLVGPGPVDRDVARASTALLSLERGFGDWTELDTAVPGDGESARRLERLAASTTVEQALRLLRSTDPTEASEGAEALQALAERDPEACAAMARDVVAAGLKDEVARTELSTLAGIGSPGAQRALADVVRGLHDSHDARWVVPLLGQVKEPTRDTLDFLRATRDDTSTPELARTASVVLGSAAHNLAASDPAGAEAIAQSLEDRLRGASDPVDVVDALAALGNTRSPRILDDAEPYLHSDDAFVRKMAATVLGQSPDPEAASLLEQISSTDADSRVRSAAARALARRNPG